jgi:S-adenosylmethionine:tRNA ribosyltransferase-isomerase
MKNTANIPHVEMAAFDYELPSDRIAMTPLANRDASKLLVRKNSIIEHSHYHHLPEFLPTNSLLIFNNTRVIAARLKFKKLTGGEIEIFLLEPADGNYACLNDREQSSWKCLVGGAKKWKNDELLLASSDLHNNNLQAQLLKKKDDHCLIKFRWTSGLPFEKIISETGKIPLPPYIKREATEDDQHRYQTVYAAHEGSVAAPTAGLHFTESLINNLSVKGIEHSFVTLHVGAGTFKPVTAAVIGEHAMHEEFYQVDIGLISQLGNADKTVVSVGTTSLRTLESIYWIAVKAIRNRNKGFSSNNNLGQWEHISLSADMLPSRAEAFQQLKELMEENAVKSIAGHTGICIAPGYTFKVANALITNFHQPQSTLLLIISAIMGDEWRSMYNNALENGYRFLSYGDGSLLFIDDNQ